MSLANKISRLEPPTAGAAAQSSVAAPGPTAAPAIWPYAHRSLAEVDTADFADAERNSGCETTDGLASAHPHPFIHEAINAR